MARVDYDGEVGRNFDAGRSLLPETIEAWREATQPFRPEAPSPVLDLGSGTGRFSPHLAVWFGRRVVGVEPAATMREGADAGDGGNVCFVGGAAEALPLRSTSCSVAWLSNVVHHFDDVGRAARELRRVLVPGGRALVRGWFSDVSRELQYWELFPTAREVAHTFPTAASVAGAFEAAGFELQATVRVEQVIARDLEHLLERLRHRADSTLVPVSDEEFEAGLAELERRARSEAPAPVRDPLELLVLG